MNELNTVHLDITFNHVGYQVAEVGENLPTGQMAHILATLLEIWLVNPLLFEQTQAIAHELKITSGHLMLLALEEYIGRHQRQLLEQINCAYQESDLSEQAYLKQMGRHHRRMVEGTW